MVCSRLAPIGLVLGGLAAAEVGTMENAGAASGTAIAVPAGTLVPLETLAGYDSFRSREGNAVRYRVTGDVVINGRIVTRAGDTAVGHVERSLSGMTAGPGPGALDRGILRMSVDAVQTFCGSTLRVSSDDHADVPDAVGDVGFPAGMPFVSTVTHTQTVCSSGR